MSKSTLYLPSMFLFLLLLQVLVLNNILLFRHINPYIYIVFIFIFPFNRNRFLFLTYSFLLGLFVDFFTDSGGVHAFATLFIAFVRLYFFKIFFQKLENEYDLFNLQLEPFGKVFNFISVLTLIHHFILFFLINFSFRNLSTVFANTLLSSIFTLILYFLGSFIFSKKQ